MKKISFNVDGLTLNGTIFYPEQVNEKSPAILFVHGWTSEQVRSFQYAESLSKLGYICLLFDMRGHGVSDGDINSFTPKDFLADVVAAYDYLVSVENVDSKKISAIGSSFGGYLLSLLTEKRKVANLVLRVPADYPNYVFSETKMKNSGSNNPEIVNWRKKKKDPPDFCKNKTQKSKSLLHQAKLNFHPVFTILML